MRPTLFRLASDTEDNDEALGKDLFYEGRSRRAPARMSGVRFLLGEAVGVGTLYNTVACYK